MNNSYKLLVKFKPSAISHVDKGILYFINDYELNDSSFISEFNYLLAIPELAENGNIICTENNIDYSMYKGLVYIEIDMTDAQLEILAKEYEQLSIVEYVILEPVDPIPPPQQKFEYGNISYIRANSNTPDLSHHQSYLFDQTEYDVYGINADYAWFLPNPIAGQGIRCADVEWGMDYEHEDLVGNNFIELLPTTNHTSDDHGTAVAGIIMARNNQFGMTGAAYNIDKYYGVSEIPNGRPYAIFLALQNLREGDILLLEMQTGGKNNNYVPPDYNKAVWDLTKSATDAGIIVIMAAGNGSENLDDSFYNEYRNRGDNGAIRVGAGTKVGRNKAYFSTYGSNMVHVQGWGDWSVASTGYGNLYNGGTHRTYTSDFSGTSSASPIVASAAILIQSWFKAHRGGILSPSRMRSLLIETGTPQGTGGHIGPLPNVRKAIEKLSK